MTYRAGDRVAYDENLGTVLAINEHGNLASVRWDNGRIISVATSDLIRPRRTKADYALLWANGMTFAEVYDLMKADIEAEVDE